MKDMEGNTIFSYQHANSSMKGYNYLQAEQDLGLLYVGVHIPNGYVSFSILNRSQLFLSYSDEFMALIGEGNGSPRFLGKHVTIENTEIKANTRLEYGVGFNYGLLDERLKLGIRLKLLKGYADVSSNKGFKATLYTDPDTYQMTVTTQNAVLNTAGVDGFDNDEINGAGYAFAPGNNGVGVDLGGTFDLNDKIKLTGAIRDLGFIKWRKYVKNYKLVNSTVSYSGIDFEDVDNLGETILDSLEAAFDTEETESVYKTSLSTQYYLSGGYSINPSTTALAMWQGKFYKGHMFNSFTIGLEKQVGKVLSANINYSLIDGKALNLGLGAILNLGTFQMFILTDNVLAGLNVDKARNTEVSFGINLNFGKTN